MSSNTINASGYGVTAVLGPTNTGKTHMAIERMVAHKSGLIGLPLRLLAREVYGRVCDKVGVANVSLVTGEERITPKGAKYQVCTVEAMPEYTNADFVAIDEVQLATDLERGHFFTDRILNLRGKHETMLLGADTMAAALHDLLPRISITTRPRMSVLEYAGSKKITRMPTRSAIVAFSADEVYAIAELVRRERGGAAVVTGSLSPRTRNAQVELYQNGDVDFLIATDAIGMGLNLDVNHVAFAQDTKYDGFQFRKLTASELAQVAGRAGRHTKDGTFGTTSRVQPFEDELIQALETHTFAPAKILTWRNRNLNYASITELKFSLEKPADHRRLMKAPPNADIIALDRLSNDPDIIDITNSSERVRLLWDVVKTPDYRKISPASHAEILAQVYMDVAREGKINEIWFADQVASSDNTNGELDALSTRIANIRTCTYLSNRDDWLENATEWREKTREVEDRLSDALHETLTKRFVDRRTSILMKRLKENRMLEAEIGDNGSVSVEGHAVGHLKGFRFVADVSEGGKDAKALNAAATKALSAEIEKRADRLAASPNSDIVLGNDGTMRWLGEAVAKLAKGDTPLKPRVIMLADEQLTGPALDKVVARLERWVSNHINTLLKPLSDLEANQELNGIARGIAFRLVENMGILARKDVADDLKNLDQDMRSIMRHNGVRFGAYHVFIPLLLKPAPSQLICLLWAIANDKMEAVGLTEVPGLSAAGRTSAPVDESFEKTFYGLSGFKLLGAKAVRIDILERLADLIRPTTSWKQDSGNEKPEGAVDGRAFYVTPAMLSILGATHEDMVTILKGLGYKEEKRLEADIKPAAETADEAAVDVPEPAETKTDAEATSEEPVEPKSILIWRYGGGGNKKFSNQNANKKFSGKKNHKGNKPMQSGAGKNNKPKKPEKQADPDSPFAALAALKGNLK
jgi:ATP-dependent RNA helicase SUPV3L1/SUV3